MRYLKRLMTVVNEINKRSLTNNDSLNENNGSVSSLLGRKLLSSLVEDVYKYLVLITRLLRSLFYAHKGIRIK